MTPRDETNASDALPPDRTDRGPRYHPLVLVWLSACLGVLADRLLGAPLSAWVIVLAVSLIAWWDLRRYRRARLASLMVLLSVVACAGAWRHMAWNLVPRNHVARYATREGRPTCIEGAVVEGVSRVAAPPFNPMRIIPSGDATTLTVRAERVRVGNDWQPATGLVPVWVRGHLDGIRAADTVRVYGRLASIAPPGNPGERDRATPCRADSVFATLNVSTPDAVERIAVGSWLWPSRWLDYVRRQGRDVLWRQLRERNAPLAHAILLGQRREVSDEQYLAFQVTGTAHLLAISGLHVALVAAGLFLVARTCLLSPRSTALLVAVLIVLYAAVTGGSPPVVRAATMVVLYCLSYYWGRKVSPFNILAAAGLLVLIRRPDDLFRAGPQLSFLAVATILWFGPLRLPAGWEPWKTVGDIPSSPRRKGDSYLIDSLRGVATAARIVVLWCTVRSLQVARMTALIWGVTLPLTLYYFQTVTPVGLVLNAVLWIPIGLALTSGFVVLLIGWLAPPMVVPAAWICDRAFDIVRWMIDLGESLPGGHWFVPGPPLWWVVGFYCLLGLWAVAPSAWRKARRVAATLGVWCVVGLAVALAVQNRPPTGLDVTILAVGHGQSVVIRLPDGKTLLYDAGHMGSPEAAGRIVSGALWALGVTRIDALIISHADADHFNAIPWLVERFPVATVYVPPQALENEGVAVRLLRQKLERANVPIRTLSAGARFEGRAADINDPASSTVPSYRIEVLHPPAGAVYRDDNETSIGLRLEVGNRAMLMLGDLEGMGLAQLLRQPTPPCDVLIAPHHGSLASDPRRLYLWCRPRHVVISGGVQDYRPAVLDAYREVGADVFHTWETGAVRVTADDKALLVKPFRATVPRPRDAAR